MRMAAHDQDTGGFYIALLKKTSPLPGPMPPRPPASGTKNTRKRPREDIDSDGDSGPSRRNKERDIHKYTRVDKDYKDLKAFRETFGIDKRVFSELCKRMYTRSPTSKTISLMSDAVQRHCLESPGADRLNIIRAGVKLLCRDRVDGVLHIRQEGIPFLLAVITKQRVFATRADISLMLDNYPEPTPMNQMSKMMTTELKASNDGCCIVVLSGYGDSNQLDADCPALAANKVTNPTDQTVSLRLRVPQQYAHYMQVRLQSLK
eukprot:GFYU01023241.1.p1 GENE.GFYU01023241.1~~GFYU01023241.1.p1  ORF type:complete len:283 (-),score=53.88 GFYU01023241.1:95-880(-)